MADEIKSLNTVEVEGYLKENTLQETVYNGIPVISGVITIALSEKEDHRIRFYVTKYGKNDTKQEKVLPTFNTLSNMLPAKTVSIATLLKANPEATFDQVKVEASPVWARASFDLYDRKDEQGELHTSVSLRGISCGLKTASSKNAFNPHTLFDIDASLDSIKPEVLKDGLETGRYIGTVSAVDHYNKVTLPMSVIFESPSAINSVQTWERGSFGHLQGMLRSTAEEVADATSSTTFLDGTTETKTVTRFINERVVARMTAPYTENMRSQYVSPEMIKDYRANREKKLAELPLGDNKNNAAKSTSAPAQAQTPSAQAQSSFKNFVL